MGKKAKKDDKGPPEDVFDPLLVESKQAGTVVLMLDSPEDDIQAKACEAIYKFVNKCDENKKTLLDLGACERLLRLMKSEEKVVRRNATMALGTMTAHPEVRRRLRKQKITVPTLLGLLNPEEYTTSHEFSTLALCNLCQEYASIATILDNNGLQPLVECIRSDDPDVQKNSIECISLILQDFEARSLMKDTATFEGMLDLLKSEYTDIQRLSLDAFVKCTMEAGNRKCLREMEALRTFVDIIGKSEYNDLHVLALNVIANLLEDTECLIQIKEAGGLSALLAFIVDQNPPEEEAPAKGGDKGKKKGGSAGGKKKKGDDDGKGKDDEKLPSYTLPEVKVQACRAIQRCAKHPINRKVLHDADTEKMLITLLGHEEESVRVASALAIAALAESSLVQEAIAKQEGFDALLRLVKSDHREPKEAATLAIANLTTGSAHNCHEVSSHHGVDHVVNCLSTEHDRIISNALVILINMSTEEPLRQKVLARGFVNAMVGPMKSPSPSVQCKACLAIASYLLEAHYRAEFRVVVGLERLVSFLDSNDADVRRAACWAISLLGADEALADSFYKLETVEKLQAINKSLTKRNRFSEVAVQRLLANNLSAKYAILGRLDVSDHIGEYFYDPGQMRDSDVLQPLELYSRDAVNNKRPILLINMAIMEKQVKVPEPNAGGTELGGSPSTTSMVSSKAAPTKVAPGKGDGGDGSRGKKGPVSTARTGSPATSVAPPAAAAPAPPVPAPPSTADGRSRPQSSTLSTSGQEAAPKGYVMPEDPTLRSYVETVRNRLAGCTNMIDAIEYLAGFVSDCLGGPVAPDAVMRFPFELSLSEVKYALQSNIVPLGMIKAGIHAHRALLFKFLADQVFLPVSLVRGEYNRAWNEVWIEPEQPAGSRSRLPSTMFLVDLMHNPGELLPANSIAANNYVKI